VGSERVSILLEGVDNLDMISDTEQLRNACIGCCAMFQYEHFTLCIQTNPHPPPKKKKKIKKKKIKKKKKNIFGYE